MPWILTALAVSLLLTRNARAGDQFIVYEAGASNWIKEGNVAIAPLTNFGCSPDTASLGPGTRAGDTPQVFVLSSPESVVRLQFNGTAVAAQTIAVYGIFIAHNSCELQETPTLAILDEAPPESPSPGSPEVGAPNGCTHFATPRTVCGALLAQYTALGASNRQRISVSTEGTRVMVINAVVGDAPAPKVSIIWNHTAQRIILPAVLVPVLALSALFSGLFLWGRRRRRRALQTGADDGLRPFVPPTPAIEPDPTRASQPTTSEKHQLVKTPVRTPAPSASVEHSEHIETLQRAIAGAGITTRELVVSLHRLREQAGNRDDNETGDGSAPPRYEG